ncbi:Protein ABA DEFICIENT 4, chloroplastic [Porphyridium purpureum]|uniref:Protein ABA DEFICIENT 4, chloroplastic n=1 Tax=Porphyridium purpureum TaxID=35688 RepID=A0A5J4Z8V3_PORPP|nr:Protein ABA DEFICIENT 4, chloroplastic [Porphyridium purpureum]|eukprot:POR9097..scf295_1
MEMFVNAATACVAVRRRCIRAGCRASRGTASASKGRTVRTAPVVQMVTAVTATEQIFQFCNTAVLPLWLLMIFAPKWKWTQTVMGSVYPAAPFAACYALLLAVPTGAEVPDASAMAEVPLQLSTVSKLLGAGGSVSAAAWVHYICFDLLAGRWIYLDGQEKNVFTSHSLLACFLAGPIGLLSHLATRSLTLVIRKDRLKEE